MLKQFIRGHRSAGIQPTRRPVPARVRRLEGEFPPVLANSVPHRKAIRDLDAIDETVEPNPRNYEPHQTSGRDWQRTGCKGVPESDSPLPYLSARDLGKKKPVRDLIQQFNPETDISPSPRDRSGSKKPNWISNPFLSSADGRQGGPLYYSKYFVDRDRRLDEKSVREEVLKQHDSLAKHSKTDPLNPERSDEARSSSRKRAIWKNYRPMSIDQIDKINSFDKVSKILCNEIHLMNEGAGREEALSALEKRYDQLLSHTSGLKKRELLVVIKVIYYFGIYQKMDRVVLNKSLDVVNNHLRRLKPDNIVYLLEALARLKFRDQRCLKYLDALSLCWPLVAKSPHLLIRAANAVARLDLASTCQASCAGLKSVLGENIPQMTTTQLEKIKAVALVDKNIFDDVMLLDYFVLCQKNDIQYSRHLLLTFIQMKANSSDLLLKLPGITREWLESVAEKESERRQTQHTLNSDENQFSSDLHRDIFRIINASPNMAREVVNSTLCGPLSFDLFIPSTNTVIDACSEFQFYQRTAKFTADARLRHSLIRELGFRLLPVTHFQWKSLKSDSDKTRWLESQLEFYR